MSPSEYQELTNFFVDQLGRHQQEIRAQLGLHQRETQTFVAVSVESLRDEIRLVADGVVTTRRSIAENTRAIDALTHRVERLETVVSTRFEDHDERLGVLESRRPSGA